MKNNLTGELGEAVTPDDVYKTGRGYAKAMGVEIGAHALMSHRGHQRPRQRGGHWQGARVARACEYCHYAHLRPEEDAAGGLTDV